MRAAAQVVPLHLVRTRVDVVVVRQLSGADLGGLVGVRVDVALVVDQLELVRLVLEVFRGLLRGGVDAADELLALLDDLLHALFQRLQIVGREWLRNVEVVVEAVVDGRTDAQLGAGKLGLHGLGEHVGAGVADHGAAELSVCRHRRERRGGLGDVREVFQLARFVLDAHDGVLPLVRQVQLPHGGADGGAGGNLERCELDCCFGRHICRALLCASLGCVIPGRRPSSTFSPDGAGGAPDARDSTPGCPKVLFRPSTRRSVPPHRAPVCPAGSSTPRIRCAWSTR